MRGAYTSFYQKASNVYRVYPRLAKFVIVGAVSGGGLLTYSQVRSYSRSAYVDAQSTIKKKKVVVLGTGWAGTSFLKNLNDPSYDVEVVSPSNYFAFTPLLPSVTVGTVEARSVVEPIRNIVKKKDIKVLFKEAECYKIDTVNQKVHCKSIQNTNAEGKEEFTVDYDYLVVAMGARANTFNTPGVVENAHFLKEVEDAVRIRRSIINSFEKASLPTVSEEEKKRILHFVVVGGGPTGVEYAAELHDYVHEDLIKLYPDLKKYINITLLEAGDHILSIFDKRITDFAEKKFQRDGIQVKTGSMVTKVTDKEISLKERSTGETKNLPYGMVVWSTGIGTRPVIMEFMKQIGQGNRRVMATDEWLRVEGLPNVYALGDCATINQRRVMEDISAIFSKADKNNTGKLNVEDFKEVINDIIERYPQIQLHLKSKKLKNFVQLLKSNEDGASKQIDIEKFKAALSEVDTKMKSLPPTAQVAAQQGKYLAKCFNRMKECEEKPEGPLRFRDTGRHRFKPFRYKHLGQFAPLGGEQTAAQLPGDYVSIGHSSQWLWYSVYASKLGMTSSSKYNNMKGTSILVSLLHWAVNKLRLNFLEITFQSVTVPNGFGILCMQASCNLAKQFSMAVFLLHLIFLTTILQGLAAQETCDACGLNNVCSLNSNRRPTCECPKGFSLFDSNDPDGNCKPDFSPSCDEVYSEDQFDFNELSDIDWPTGDYASMDPSNEEDCKTSCLKDCFCAVAIYRSHQCWKKKLPLTNGKKDITLNVTAFLKYRKGDRPPRCPPL
ncbi:NAD(P)H dehydrogenase B4 [Artemisia annua]|uniref:NAD(P)H dehydrogenase B4 n=1 Tax=Artemisia annua TaxID=35608 RepID=A0A2U1NI58_ARTAN|nr:NAD(P)H dehydrogenase B4 [Artemisia annua]